MNRAVVGNHRNRPIPADLDATQRILFELCPDLVVHRVERGRIIAHEGSETDRFILLLKGWIAFFKSLRDGQIQIVDLLLPNEFMMIATDGAPRNPYSAEALTDAEYVLFSEEMINGPQPEAAVLRSYIGSSMAIIQARTAELLLRLGQASAESRIAYAILELYVRLEASGQVAATRFHVPMTQTQLGEFTGLSNVHVCRTLRRFARNGIVASTSGTDFEIFDIGELCRIADIDFEEFRAAILQHDGSIRGAVHPA